MKIEIKCAYDKIVSLKELKPHPKNPNKHSEDQVLRLSEILQYQGIRRPIRVSTRSGCITAGHGLSLSLLLLGEEEAPVNFQDYESEEQEFADIVADNAIASWADLDLAAINLEVPELGPDFDINLLGLKDFEIEPADKYADQDADAVPEVKDAFVKLGELWSLGRHRLLCGDSTRSDLVERLMNGEKTDMIFTDPPYGISIVKGRTVGTASKVGFVGLKSQAPSQMVKARQYKEIIGDDEAFDPAFILGLEYKVAVLWGANHYSSRLPDRPQWLVWDKKLESGSLDHNNFSDCELAWTNSEKLSTRTYRHTWSGLLRKGPRNEELTERVHPTQKPVGLCADIISDFSTANESILDLYLGSGSTLIACEKTNRRCFGMEIDPHYCSVIIERWQKFTGLTANKLE